MEKTLKLSLEISKEVTVREEMRVYTDKIPVSESEDKEISDKIDKGEYIIDIKRKGIYSSEGERLYHVSIVDCLKPVSKKSNMSSMLYA
jgi:hypothetical protein